MDMENLNSLPQGTVSVDQLYHLNDVKSLESVLFDAILSSPSIFSFKDFCKRYVIRKYSQEQISRALQSLLSRKFISYDNQFSIIKLHLQSVFPYSTPQISDHWLS
jgi:hypothetical protein